MVRSYLGAMFLPGVGMTPIGFANPWEHLRLLSDPDRNQALVTLLERRAPGATVAEIGCGTGLLSLVAARLGAKKVFAIEPTGCGRSRRPWSSTMGCRT